MTQEPVSINITRVRGDTFPFSFAIKDSDGNAIDITGYSFILTVDPSDEPPDASNNLFALTGTVTDGPGGIVQFALTAMQADQTPATYYYDVQMTDTSGNIRTIIKGEWAVQQDITKT